MTREISDILTAYKEAQLHRRRIALATVVHVEGSSYRRPGARMLVEENGQLTGAISGGCLEGDALKKAQLAILQKQNKLVIYDTTDEDDATFGVQLGCNGIVYILFEPIDDASALHPLTLLQQAAQQRQPVVLATLFSLAHFAGPQPGTVLLQTSKERIGQLPGNELFQKSIWHDADEAIRTQTSFMNLYQDDNKQWNGFVEYIKPAPSVVIAGAGNDVMPLVEMAAVLGWQITVVDGRSTHATTQRFPKADAVLVAKPDDVLRLITVDAQTVFLLMTHNYNYDLALLQQLIGRDEIAYIGLLGPKKKAQRMLDELRAAGVTIHDGVLKKLFGPMGLDVGAETAEEIALSVLAEIKKVLEVRSGLSLRDKKEAIHTTAERSLSTLETNA